MIHHTTEIVSTTKTNHQDVLERLANRFGDLAEYAYDHRWPMLIAGLATFGMALYFASFARIDTSLDAFFDANDPSYRYYDRYREDFGSDEIAYILYRVPDAKHGPFNLQVMHKITELTRALQTEVPFVSKVTSLTNAEFMESDDDLIQIHELLSEFPRSQRELLKVRDLVINNPIYVGNLVNAKADHATIIVKTTRAATDAVEKLRLDPEGGDGLDNLYPQVTNNKITEILSRPEYKGIEFYHSGDVPFNSVYNELALSEPPQLVAITFAIIMLLGAFLFRTGITALIGPLLVVSCSIILTIAAMVLLGWDLDVMFGLTPTLLTAIGVAQSVHLISEFQHARRLGMRRRAALRQAMVLVGNPCLLAALTTAVGFFAMVFAKLPGVTHFAVYGALGVMLTFFLSATLLLCLLSFGEDDPLPTSGQEASDLTHRGGNWLEAMLAWIAALVIRYPKRIVCIGAAILLFALGGAAQLKIDFNFLTELKPHVPWRVNTEYVEEHMGGTLSIVYVFNAGEDGIKDPAILQRIEALQAHAENDPLVKKTLSVVDTLKQLNQAFHGDDPAYYKLPKDRELIAQYLLMYEISGGEELQQYVTADFSRAVVQLRVEMTNASNIRRVLDSLKSFEQENRSQELKMETTGVGLLWVKTADYIASSQLSGYSVAFGIITLLMCVIFRSVKVGLLSMVPNLTPVLLVLGYMGWQDMFLDYYRLLLATIAIGIAVDDTVHLVARMRREYAQCGDYELALQRSLAGVGQALVCTSIILVTCFLVLLGSDAQVMASFGISLAAITLAALTADLFLMPAMLLVFKPFDEKVPARSVASVNELAAC
ncbi:MAG: efflux RND transporter permease subunit [Pseudomonadales bacterium]